MRVLDLTKYLIFTLVSGTGYLYKWLIGVYNDTAILQVKKEVLSKS